VRHDRQVQRTTVDLASPSLAAVRGRMALPLAAGGPDAAAEGTQVRPWHDLVDPASGLLEQVAADWAARGGFDDDRRPWVLTVFGLAHQLTHGTVAHLAVQRCALDLGGLRVRVRRTGPGRLRAAGLVLDDPAPGWTGDDDDLAARWWDETGRACAPLLAQASAHGVREAVGWGEPVGLATVACRTLGEAGVPGTRELAGRLAEVSGRAHLTATEDDPQGAPPGWRARRTTCCQWWQSAHDAHYCVECPLHLSPRAAEHPLPTDH
jgi:hypothetical protein